MPERHLLGVWNPSYAVDAMRSVTTDAEVGAGAWADLGIVGLAVLLALGLGAATLRRRTP